MRDARFTVSPQRSNWSRRSPITRRDPAQPLAARLKRQGEWREDRQVPGHDADSLAQSSAVIVLGLIGEGQASNDGVRSTTGGLRRQSLRRRAHCKAPGTRRRSRR